MRTATSPDSRIAIAGPKIATGGDMKLTIRSLLLLVAVILFVAAAFGLDVRGSLLIPLGLAFLAAAFLAPGGVLGFGR